ncbi:hypothetical protein BV133_1510 [Blastochloris viridis]|uniref:Capsule polysaccharide biosynthesis protein n=1 Tax=Blastochloris viridis TaxID=1079 RepID=A0A0H5BPD1_BLAVI|nr:hypothetical protein BV133_1510 [Blastochloris viridis]CUU43579.1 hypothetical protein BVIRIDIS_26030 [Blastochloris viridis]
MTGDIFRPFRLGQRWESATWKNVRWLDGIAGTAARLAGWDVATVSWDPALRRSHGNVDMPAIYDALGLPLDRAGWVELLRRPMLPDAIERELLDLFDADLVVGYEIPDHLLRILSRAGIAVVDVILHPVRFLDDVVFALRTNRADIHALLAQHAVAREAIALQAGLIRSKAAWMRPPLPLRPGAALVLGQVGDDRAAIDTATGRNRSLADHAGRLLELCADSSMVLFKPHPYDPAQSDTGITLRRLQAVQWTNANFYHLIAQPEIDVVCALNSSGLVEAEYFGKAALWLAPPLYRFGDTAPADGGFGDALPQDGAWCNPAFWSAVRGAGPAAVLAAVRPNRLRRALNADWGFSSIDKVVA